MKKTVLLILFCALTIGGALMLSSCKMDGSGPTGPVEEVVSVGTVILINNSNNVEIIYVSIEKGGNKTEFRQLSISSGDSYSFTNIPPGSYTVYLEDVDGDPWVTKSFVTVKKDSTVEVKFQNDFEPANLEIQG